MPITPTPKIWMNGQLVDWDQANVHILTHSLHYGLGEGAEKALLADLCPAESRGRAFGLREALSGAALLPANVGFGYLYMKNPSWAFGTSAVMAGLAALALISLVPSPSDRQRDAAQH